MKRAHEGERDSKEGSGKIRSCADSGVECRMKVINTKRKVNKAAEWNNSVTLWCFFLVLGLLRQHTARSADDVFRVFVYIYICVYVRVCVCVSLQLSLFVWVYCLLLVAFSLSLCMF